jgi:hypothetical protein
LAFDGIRAAAAGVAGRGDVRLQSSAATSTPTPVRFTKRSTPDARLTFQAREPNIADFINRPAFDRALRNCAYGLRRREPARHLRPRVSWTDAMRVHIVLRSEDDDRDRFTMLPLAAIERRAARTPQAQLDM